jgi:hypothetical protein
LVWSVLPQTVSALGGGIGQREGILLLTLGRWRRKLTLSESDEKDAQFVVKALNISSVDASCIGATSRPYDENGQSRTIGGFRRSYFRFVVARAFCLWIVVKDSILSEIVRITSTGMQERHRYPVWSKGVPGALLIGIDAPGSRV